MRPHRGLRSHESLGAIPGDEIHTQANLKPVVHPSSRAFQFAGGIIRRGKGELENCSL